MAMGFLMNRETLPGAPVSKDVSETNVPLKIDLMNTYLFYQRLDIVLLA